ncbi:MAG: hypothetical protein WAO35_12240 [Terriglobia bacterium]
MTNSPDAPNPRKGRKLRRLTDIEKWDGRFPGLATQARQLLDSGIAVPKVAEILRSHFPAPVTASAVGSFRARRWGPQKDDLKADSRAAEVLFDKVGGNHGLDLVAFARVRELLKTTDIKEANAVRLAVLKIRAQDLKEEEFKFKASKLKPGQNSDDEELDPETQSRNALRRIKEIFGLAGDEPPAPPPPRVPAAGDSPLPKREGESPAEL